MASPHNVFTRSNLGRLRPCVRSDQESSFLSGRGPNLQTPAKWFSLFWSYSLYIALLIFGHAESSKDDAAFEFITSRDGLSSDMVNAVIQDRDGYMWFGTNHGLNRYNGYEVTTIRPKNSESIPPKHITTLCQDQEGIIWIGTMLDGIILFDPATEDFAPFERNDESPIELTEIKEIICGHDGTIWIAAARSGLVSFDKTQNELKQHPLNVTFYSMCVFEDSKRNIWTGGWNDGFYQYTPSTGASIHYLEDSSKNGENRVNHISEDSEGSIWIGMWRGSLKKMISGYSSEEEVEYLRFPFNPKTTDSISHNIINDITTDALGNVWVSTMHGLNRFEKVPGMENEYKLTKFVTNTIERTEYNEIKGLNNDEILDIHIDEENTLWLATYGGGLNKLLIKSRKFHYLENLVSNVTFEYKNVKTVFQTKEDELWLGMQGPGLVIYNTESKLGHPYYLDDRLSNLPHKDKGGISINTVTTILSEEHNGKKLIFIGTRYQGLFILDFGASYGNTPEFINLPRAVPEVPIGLRGREVNALIKDHDNRFWVGTTEGLDRIVLSEHLGVEDKITIDDVTVQDYTPLIASHQHPDIQVNSLALDKSGRLWIGASDSPLISLSVDQARGNANTTRRYLGKYSDYKKLDIQKIHIDRKERIWLGASSRGLLQFDQSEHRFIESGLENGLSTNHVSEIVEDKHGNLWLGTNAGVGLFSPDANTDSKIKIYNYEDGLASNAINRGSGHINQDGRIFLGSAFGLNYFDPDRIKNNPIIPAVKIEDITVYNRRSKSGQERSLIDNDPTRNTGAKTLLLKPGDYSFSANLASLSYVNPDQNRFAYTLEGHDVQWNYVQPENRLLKYNNLLPGEYILRVKGSNNDGAWNEEGAELEIVVLPPFWQTWWFRAFVLMFISSTLILFYYRRVGQINRQKRELEAQVKLRTNELECANSELVVQKEELQLHRNHLEKLVVERTKDLQEAKERAETSDRLKSSFLANMSHEIRTPLNAIVGFSALLTEDPLEQEQKESYVDLLNDNTERLLCLFHDILDISSIESGNMKIQKEVFDLNKLLKGIHTEYSDKIHENESKNIRIFLESPEEEVFINADMTRIRQILSNLLDNAVKFTSEGYIKISLRELKGEVEIAIADSGIGFSSEKKEFVFERFTKVEDDKSVLHRGTGIGLYISRELVRMHGGEIEVESEIGNGSTFHFTVPQNA